MQKFLRAFCVQCGPESRARFRSNVGKSRDPISATCCTLLMQAYTLEVCMTGLDPVKAAQFVRGPGFVSAEATTNASGIRTLLPGANIDDYV